MVEEFYDELCENGIPFKVRRMNTLLDMPTYKKPSEGKQGKEVKEDNKLKTNRTYNVQDEVLAK